MNKYTLAIIKPDILVKHPDRLKEILDIISSKFIIHQQKEIQLSITDAENFYNDHRGKFFYERLVCFMTRGPIIPLILSDKNPQGDSVKSWRDCIGPTHAENARKLDCLRGRYGSSDTWNGFHGSGNYEEANNEINFFFPEFFKSK